MIWGFYFVTTANTETLNGTVLGVTVVSSPPCPICFKSEGAKRKLHPTSYRLSNKYLAMKCQYTNQTPFNKWICQGYASWFVCHPFAGATLILSASFQF